MADNSPVIAAARSDNVAGTPHRWGRVALLLSRLGLPLALALALVLRLSLIARAPGVLDGDEALVGIQAEHIAAGTAHPLPVFFYGQHYMGSLEAYLAAGVFRLVGPSVPALRLVPLFFALLLVALVYDLARRVVGRQAALPAALLAACAPVYVGVWSLKARGGYIETIALGTGLLIVTHRLLYGPAAPLDLAAPLRGRRWREYGWLLLWGLLAGVLFWISPLSLYYILTAAGALVVAALRRRGWRLRRSDPRVAAAPLGLILAGALIGGLPLWADNIQTRGATFGYLFAGSSGGSPFERVPRVAAFFVDAVLPKLTGAWEPWGAALNRSWAAGILGLYGLALLYLLVRLLAGRRGVLGYRALPRHGQGLLLAFAAVVAVLFCVSGFGGAALNPFGFDAASRYALPLASVLPVLAGALIWRLWRFWAPLGALALAALLLASATGYALARPQEVFQSEYWAKLPPSEAPLAAFLERNGVRDVWMNHWAGYPLMFQTNGRITVADYNDVLLNQGVNRLPAAMRQVAADPHAAYVLVTDEGDPPLAGLLHTRHVTFRRERVGPYLVFWNLSRPVPPADVAPGIGFAY